MNQNTHQHIEIMQESKEALDLHSKTLTYRFHIHLQKFQAAWLLF